MKPIAFYKYEKACEVLQCDGFWASDDLGHQTGPMMSPEIFHELIYPYYKRVGDKLKSSNMHFWLHSCGDNTLLLPDLIDTFDRPGGGMCIAAGNGIVSGTAFENIEAFLDEAVTYGPAHRQRKL